ncbi:MAG: hypothetical protein V1817_01290 [Candidatus Micrarchaeota archaeon]
MDVNGAGIVAFLLIGGAAYWLVTSLVPKVKSEVLDNFLTNQQLASGLVSLVVITIVLAMGGAALGQLGQALVGDNVGEYISALAAPLNAASGAVGNLWAMLSVAAYIFIGLALFNALGRSKPLPPQ